MSAAAGVRASRDRREAASFAAVVVLVAVALTAGLLIRMLVDRAVERVDPGGLNAELPAGWIVLPAAGDRLLTAYDPLDPDLRYGVAAIDPVAAVDPATGTAITPEDAAARRLGDRGQLLQAFVIRSEGPGSLGSVPTYQVRYTFVDQAPGGQASQIEAIEHYFGDGAIFPGEDRILAVILEAPPDKLDAAVADFERFARELAGRAGIAAAPIPVAGLRGIERQLASIGGSGVGAAAPPAAARGPGHPPPPHRRLRGGQTAG